MTALDRYIKAVNQGDVPGVVGAFTADGVLEIGEIAQGAAAIQSYMESLSGRSVEMRTVESFGTPVAGVVRGTLCTGKLTEVFSAHYEAVEPDGLLRCLRIYTQTAKPKGGVRLLGKIAVVTGGGDGIGSAIARRFSEEGATVVVVDINKEKGSTVATEVSGKYFELDVTDADGWERLQTFLMEVYGGLDILVNNAGIVSPDNIQTCDPVNFQKHLAVHTMGTMLGCKTAIAVMTKTPRTTKGSIINISSVAATSGIATVTSYCTAKAGVASLTATTASHLAGELLPIRCNSLMPGAVRTPLLEGFLQGVADGTYTVEGHAMEPQYVCEPLEVANLALFLAGDESSHLNGSQIRIDGGRLDRPY